MPSKKSNHSQFVAALSGSLPGAGITDLDAVVARLAAEGAGGGMTKEVCMAVRKSGIPVLLPLLYLVPGVGALAWAVVLLYWFPSQAIAQCADAIQYAAAWNAK